MATKIKPLASKAKKTVKTKDIKLEQFNKIIDDLPFFCSEFVKIVDNFGELIPFKFNKEQAAFIDTMERFNIILKSRQIGFSTVSLAICLWNAVKRPNSSYMIVSLDKKQVSELFGRLKRMNDNLPRETYPYFPATVRDNRDELVLSNGSRIQVSPPDINIGRGSTYQYVLLSEMAFYEVDQAKLLTSVTQSMAKNPDSKLVIESTANGTGNYYYELFNKSFKGLTNYKAYFYSWISDAHKSQFKSEIEQAHDWYKSINKGRKMLSADLETNEEQRLHKAGATLAMLEWRRWKLTSMPIEDFQTEYPSTHTEAFKTSGKNVFNQSKILDRMNNLSSAIDIETLKIELPQTLHKWIGKGLSVYHLPKRGRYYGGSDVASGSGGDSSSLTIIDTEGIEVAAFHDNKISVYEFAEFLNDIGRFYVYAYLAIEKNSYGLPVIERLREQFKYANMYKHKTFDNKGNRKLILGWLTTETTKSIMISDFKEQFEKDLILINHSETLVQMQMFVEDSKGKLGNKKGAKNHDDLVISHALAVQAKKSGKWYV